MCILYIVSYLRVISPHLLLAKDYSSIRSNTEMVLPLDIGMMAALVTLELIAVRYRIASVLIGTAFIYQ